MSDNTPEETEIKSAVKAIYIEYAVELGRDVTGVTPDTKLKFPFGLEFTSVQMKSRKVHLNTIIQSYFGRYLTDNEAVGFSTIKAAQDEIWKRVKPSED